MKTAVTGGTGVVGRAVVRHLVAAGHEVSVLVRGDDAGVRAAGARPVSGHVLDPSSLDRLVEGAELVFHVAGVNRLCAPDPGELWRVNVGGTRTVLVAARRAGVRRVVHTSSAVTIGEPDGEVGMEGTRRRPGFLSHYERTKTEAEVAALQTREPEVVAVNPASVQGPGRVTGTGRLLLQAARGRVRVAVDAVFSMVDIDDCARGHLLAAERGAPGERYILSGSTLTVRAALAILRDVVGHLPPVRFVDPRLLVPLGWLVGPVAGVLGREALLCPEAVRVLRHVHRVDGSKASRALGLSYTPAADTLRRTVEWYRAEGLL